MKTLTIHGVPYSINEKNEVFLYKGSTDLSIGSWDASKQKLTLDPKWQELAQPFLATYRNQVEESSVTAMKKAKELQGVSTSASST